MGYGCCLCGVDIHDGPRQNTLRQPPPWNTQCRVLYSCNNIAQLSGIGSILEFRYMVPEDPDIAWDHADYWDVPAPTLAAINEDYTGPAFPFHVACWSLLSAAFRPEQIPLERLLAVCQSTHLINTHRLDWLHSYGGLYVNNGDACWNRNLQVISVETAPPGADLEYFTTDPFTVLGMEELSNKKWQPEKASEHSTPQWGQNDVFSNLPEDVCYEIATHLSTKDALTMHLVSRHFAQPTFRKSFWLSRFRGRGERVWLLESRTWDRAVDWEYVYCKTTDKHCGKQLKNRQRIWKLAQHLVDLVDLVWVLAPAPMVNLKHDQCATQWIDTNGDIYRPTDEDDGYKGFVNSKKHCRLIHEVEIPLTQDARSISFATRDIGDFQYLVGLTIISADEKKTAMQIGYRGTTNTAEFDVELLTGFRVAADPSGICGIQCGFAPTPNTALSSGRLWSQWFGASDGVPVTEKLKDLSTIYALRIGFDVSARQSMALPYM
ncbi:hypothetical protein VHEMI04126 [[Torrubiella] hemipterigena]|uniref:F-box domain-containing protein n=1 Tax=[Torrubiella] hemipterigena TaxID=1531966 RepID=A0A0A1TDE4_9HYPO|nr:hypothetical protein VHEMI04126 [[Torrubiella] hemipterigena]